ncbi:MAG: cytochrome c peroxidase, partial [Burkholderiaceae bacterium]
MRFALSWPSRLVRFAIAACAAGVAAGVPAGAPAPRIYGDRPTVDQLSGLGRAIFNDRALSSGGRLACASCHDPAFAFGPAPTAPNPFADGDPAHAGTRAIPSLRYAQYARRFTEHAIDDEDGHGVDAGPSGGLTWDGRADSARQQARLPLFAANEMGNADDASLARKLAAAPYAAAFRNAFSAPGRDVFDDPQQVVGWMAFALEVYQQGKEFAPFDSEYDRALAGKAVLSPAQSRGLALYGDEMKGNCESCHPGARRSTGAAPLFTDGGFVAAAAPRRPGLPPLAASSAAPYPIASAASGPEADLGLCRSGRPGLTDAPGFCGRFRTPTLRNVALRTRFFHNGSLRSLRDVVAFYATRDTDPGRWYPRNPDGSVHRYDDLPAEMTPSVDHGAPFEPLPGGRPRLGDGEIDDIVAFLRTLTDA